MVDLVNARQPESVTLDPRIVVPAMSAVASLSLGNLLTVESAPTAVVLDARLLVSVRSALLDRVAAPARFDIEVINA